jgi:hypothetical protein
VSTWHKLLVPIEKVRSAVRCEIVIVNFKFAILLKTDFESMISFVVHVVLCLLGLGQA